MTRGSGHRRASNRPSVRAGLLVEAALEVLVELSIATGHIASGELPEQLLLLAGPSG